MQLVSLFTVYDSDMTCLPALICALLVGGSWGRSVQLVEGPQDSKLDQAPVKYVITGQKDTDGRWTEEVKMEHGEEDWHIDVDHMTLEVGEGQPKVKITATFSAKSKTHDAAVVPDEESPESAEGIGDTVFQLFPRSQRDWFDAQRQCEEWGGHLAIPDTRAKMRELTRMLRQYVKDIGETTAVFLGFDDLKREGHFVTVLGKPLFGSQEDSSWSPHWYQAGEPNDDKEWTKDGEDCGSLRDTGGLNDVPCRFNLPFICEKSAAVAEKAVDEEEATTNEVAAPEDEDDEDTLLQLFHEHHMDFFDARSNCFDWGGHMAIPKSGAKMLKMIEMLKSSMESSDVRAAFVGYNNIQRKTTSSNPANKEYSAGSLPDWLRATQVNENDDDDEPGWTRVLNDCVVLHAAGGLGVAPCMHRLPYFCEKSKPDADASSATDAPSDADASSDAETPEVTTEQSGDTEPSVPDSHEVDTLTLFEMDDLDWFAANDACLELWGGHLAIPDSAEKMEAMTSKMKLANVPAAFLGFGDQEREGHFVTIFGEPVFSESSWSPRWWREDQPDDDKGWFADGEDCGSVRVGGGLNDVPCRYHMPFFCEKPSTDVVQASTEESQLTAEEATRESSSSLAPPDDTVDVIGREDIILSSGERKFVQFLSSFNIKNIPANDETPTAVQSSGEVVSVDKALSQLISDIEAILPTLTDSPISAQRNSENES